MPTRFLKREGTKLSLTSVSRENPLPVQIYNAESLPTLSTTPTAVETLLVGEVIVDGTTRDLLNNTGAEVPTFTNATPYRRFILVFHKGGADPIQITLKGRTSDSAGNDAYSGWLTLATVTSTVNNAWDRAVLEASDGKPLGCDIYRIEVVRTAGTSSQTVRFSLKGER